VIVNDYIDKYYDSKRVANGKEPIPCVVVWSDQAPTQYRCRQNFRNVAESSKKSMKGRGFVRIHKFGAKYKFKGPWDAFGKHIKDEINRLEFF